VRQPGIGHGAAKGNEMRGSARSIGFHKSESGPFSTITEAPMSDRDEPRASMMRLCSIALLAATAASLPAQTPDRPTGFPVACAPSEVQVMILGTYHFANPGRDVIKQDFDDVLQPKRQVELEDLVTRLASWKPDRIAVEWPFSQTDTIRARYERFLARTLAPNRNEVVQIGFRLASQLGHPAVFPIDDDSFLDVNDSLKAVDQRRPGFRKTRDSIVASLQKQAEAENAWMRTTTIREHLLRLNSDEALHRGNSLGMFGGYLQAGEGQNYGGPQLLAQWYARNFNMAHNLTRMLEPELKRILVIVGSGHVPPLRNLLDEAPQFCPVSPLSLLR
jgi:hypothetical protein